MESHKDPEFPKALEQIGAENILEKLEFIFNYNDFIINVDELKKLLTYNQLYVLMCNLSWESLKYIGMPLREELKYTIKSHLYQVIEKLSRCETNIGNFGQDRDFKLMVSAEDFGLMEIE